MVGQRGRFLTCWAISLVERCHPAGYLSCCVLGKSSSPIIRSTKFPEYLKEEGFKLPEKEQRNETIQLKASTRVRN